MALVEDRKDTLAEEAKRTASSVKNVLFATDFSATSEAALPYATAICRRFGSTLHAVHVLSDAGLVMITGGVDYVSMGTIYEDAHTEAKEKLDQMTARFEGFPHQTYVRHGQVWKNLAAIVQENNIDLIVVGTHGRTGLGKLLLGSVAEDILRHAPCPVLTIGPRVSGRDKLPAFPAHGRDLAPVELSCGTSCAPPILTRTRLASFRRPWRWPRSSAAGSPDARDRRLHATGQPPRADRGRCPAAAGADSEECGSAIRARERAGIWLSLGTHP